MAKPIFMHFGAVSVDKKTGNVKIGNWDLSALFASMEGKEVQFTAQERELADKSEVKK